jgi:hypothetical protein
MGQGFPWPKLQNLSPYEIGPWNGSKGFTLRGPTVGPFAKEGPICKRGAHLQKRGPFVDPNTLPNGFQPNRLGPKCKVPLRVSWNQTFLYKCIKMINSGLYIRMLPCYWLGCYYSWFNSWRSRFSVLDSIHCGFYDNLSHN